MTGGDLEIWRSGSIWSRHLDLTERRGLEGEHRVDVAVVGAGITGLLTAVLLSRTGASVLVLDRYEVGGIATRNTTAKVTALQGAMYRTIARARNAEAAASYAAAQLDAVAGLRALIGELGIECAVTDAPAYTYAVAGAGASRVHEEAAAAAAAGLEVAETVDIGLPFPVEAAVRLDGQFHMDPGALCRGLAAILGAGQIAERTVVTDIEEGRDRCIVRTESSATVLADHVVVATQSPIVDPALLANRCKPSQSYCLAARLPVDLPAGMYLSVDDATRSLRPAVLDGAPVAVVGGEGHESGSPKATEDRWAVLTDWLVDSFGPAEVTHRWATHDLSPTDHVPFIGALSPRSSRRWVATGFGKWGMTNGYVAARLLTACIGGAAPVPWADTFDATRIASTLNSDLLSAGATAASHLVGDRLARRPEPRCTHQGCVLRRDDALDTWDCPCHGSRFASDGTPIQGPAVARLDI